MIKSLEQVMWDIHEYIEFGEVDTAKKILKDYGDSIVDECCNNAKLELLPNHMGDINGDCYCVGHESILQVKEQIK